MELKETTKRMLDRLPIGAEISTEQMKDHVQFMAQREGEYVNPHRDTMLRYLREMKIGTQRQFECVNKPKSIYRRVR